MIAYLKAKDRCAMHETQLPTERDRSLEDAIHLNISTFIMGITRHPRIAFTHDVVALFSTQAKTFLMAKDFKFGPQDK